MGVTYSPKQSGYFAQDWKKVYLSVLEMGFEIVRLGAYWSDIEKEEGIYDFTDLDWQLEEAGKRKIAVLLTVGMKAPRWPEYYIPKWVLKKARLRFGQDVSRDPYLGDKTLKFIERVVERYRYNRAVQYWQVENEPLDRAGQHYWWIGKKFLKEEVDLVRSLDPRKRPIVVNVATYPNKFLHCVVRLSSPTYPVTNALPICDILGLNIYPTVGHKMWWFKLYFWTHSHERSECFAGIIKRARQHGKAVWITELQAEPWEPGEVVHKGKEEPSTVWPDMIDVAFREIRSLGVDTIFLWGVEYWYFRKEHHHDESWWEKASRILRVKKEKPPADQ